MTKNRRWIMLTAALLLVAAAGAAWFVISRPVPQAPSGGTMAISADELHTLGNPHAKVVVIEYASLICPICAYFNVNTFPTFRSKYIETDKVLYVYRLFPIDVADTKAEKVARCLPKSQYFSFTDMLYRRQDEWGAEQMEERGLPEQPKTEAGLLKMARSAGLDTARAQACMTDTAQNESIDAVTTVGRLQYGINATPTFVVNGQTLAPGARSLEELSAAIDPLLAGN